MEYDTSLVQGWDQLDALTSSDVYTIEAILMLQILPARFVQQVLYVTELGLFLSKDAVIALLSKSTYYHRGVYS